MAWYNQQNNFEQSAFMDNIISYLEQLQVSPLEAKLYLAIVKTGAITATDLAHKLGINRTQVYPSLDLLFKKGLVMKMVKGSQTHYASLEPKDSLPPLVTKKEQDFKAIKTDLPTIMAALEGLQGEEQENEDVEIKYYKGKAGVKRIYEDILKAKEQRSYVDTTKIPEVFPENFQLFVDALKHNPDMKMYEVFQDSTNAPKTNQYIKVMGNKNYFYKLLPKGMKLNAQDIIIYDNKVAIISLDENISGVVLQNRDLYNNFKILFDLMWKLLP